MTHSISAAGVTPALRLAANRLSPASSRSRTDLNRACKIARRDEAVKRGLADIKGGANLLRREEGLHWAARWAGGETMLAPKALDGLNTDARCFLLAMINTGARPSELAALTGEQIHLDAKVPHISIEPVGRQLKTRNARRVIPLVGVSLDAFKTCPVGFPKYRGSSASLSATINKYLRENGLMETSEHSLYGLRHSFEDRLLAAGIDERIRRDLFGHALNRERYGKGASLAHIRDLVQRVAL